MSVGHGLDEVDDLVRAVWRSSVSALVERAQTTRTPDVRWRAVGGVWRAQVGVDELIITTADEGDQVLLFRWGRRHGQPRELARGETEDLQRRAPAILEAGLHGGPDVWDPRHRRLPLLEFSPPTRGVYVASFGRGYEARVVPVPTGTHALVVVSPRGSFLFLGFGSPINLAIRAHDAALGLDVVLDDIPVDRRPIHVIVEGAPRRLIHTKQPGLVGWAVTPVGKVFLLLLGAYDLALVLEDPSGARHLLARDDHHRINGLVVHQERAELGPLIGPRTPDREGVAAALARVPTLVPELRDGLCRALEDANQRVGMAMARHLIWAIVAAQAGGQREILALETEALFQWFRDRDLLDAMPCERVRRESLRWLETRTGLVSRSRKGSPIWRVHFDLLTHPTTAFLSCLAP